MNRPNPITSNKTRVRFSHLFTILSISSWFFDLFMPHSCQILPSFHDSSIFSCLVASDFLPSFIAKPGFCGLELSISPHFKKIILAVFFSQPWFGVSKSCKCNKFGHMMSKFVALQLSAMLGGFHDIPVSTSTCLILHAIWCIEAQLVIRDPCYEHILILREILLLHRIMGWNMGISSFDVAYNHMGWNLGYHHQPIMLHDGGASLQQTNCSVLSGYVDGSSCNLFVARKLLCYEPSSSTHHASWQRSFLATNKLLCLIRLCGMDLHAICSKTFSYCEKLKGIIRLAWKIVDKILNCLYTQLQRFAVESGTNHTTKCNSRENWQIHTQGTRNVQLVLWLLLNAILMDVLRFLGLLSNNPSAMKNLPCL